MDNNVDTHLEDNYEDDPWNEPICQNCTYYFHHNDDDDSMGICSLDKDFEPYWENEDLMENFDFSCCRELYLKKSFDGLREACDTFEKSTIMDIPEGMSIDTYLHLESLKDADPSELFQSLREENREISLLALNQICSLISLGNEAAFNDLIAYYMALGPATTLEEVKYRIKLIDALSCRSRSATLIEVYIQELARTPSNNTTRSLYTKILKELGRFPQEDICEPLEKLLSQVEYSYKIKRRIKEVAGLIETEDDGWFYFFQE